MELLDRYLMAVKFYLPKTQKNDIIKELSDNILSHMEDKEAELGRPLSEAEQETMLKQHGHPMLVASRYRHLPFQYLIGPAMFPFYWHALVTTLLFVVVINVAVGAISVLAGADLPGALLLAWGGLWLFAGLGFGIVTVVFALLEYFQVKLHFLDEWNVRSLPAVAMGAQRISRARSISELVLGILFLLWWLAWSRFSFTIFGQAATIVKLSPVWQSFQWPIFLLVFAWMVQAGVNLVRPNWIRFRSATRLITQTVTLVLIYLLVRAGDLVVIADPTGTLHSRAVEIGNHAFSVIEIVNYSVSFSLIIPGIVFILDSLWEVRRWF
jgi:hypothetical protein